ncbi:hypothetical protein JOB18_034727 [Solea senegalensis]|uniref:Uncharacterized protein n=1 Tax=Solea senegalensis TaxID=28829 RepID=A0AAV6QZU1_SOLSE|nr:hypothetical protein JOB18_034727 [Solea senegalensis]
MFSSSSLFRMRDDKLSPVVSSATRKPKKCSLTCEPGDRVLLKNVGLKGKDKLENHWYDVPYVVVDKMPNLPFYRVKPVDGKGKFKTLHRDNLLPTGDLVRILVLDNTEDVPKRAATQSRAFNRCKRSITNHTIPREPNTSTDSSDLECEWPTRPYRKFVEKIIQGRGRHSADGSEHLEATCPSDGRHSERGDSLVDHGQDVALKTDSEPEPISSEDAQPQSSCSNVHVTPKSTRPKRSLKPVMRLTYDEPAMLKNTGSIMAFPRVTQMIVFFIMYHFKSNCCWSRQCIMYVLKWVYPEKEVMHFIASGQDKYTFQKKFINKEKRITEQGVHVRHTVLLAQDCDHVCPNSTTCCY